MKQKGTRVVFALPKRLPKTIGGLSNWNRKLLQDCLRYEFKKRALTAALEKCAAEFTRYVPYAHDDGPVGAAARMALKEFNLAKGELQSELDEIKEIVRILHDTNELIVGSVIKDRLPPESFKEVFSDRHPETNLLHGEGWILEIATADILKKKGHAAFVTFGTGLDANGFDVVAVPNPGSPITWNRKRLRRCVRT